MRNRLLLRYLRSPEHPAKYRIVKWLGRHVFPRDGVIAEVLPGVRLYLHPRDWIDYLLLRGSRYEPDTLTFLSKNLRPSDNALLAGVNNGLHLIVAARAVGDTGRVIGVEPQPAALLRARTNIDLNALAGSIHLIAAAVGSESGLAHMAWSDPSNTGAASLLDAGPGVEVPVMPISAILEASCAGRLRLMLLDVQGYEGPALGGLGLCRPDLLVVEESPEYLAPVGPARAGLHSQMIDLGYALHDLFGDPVGDSGPWPAEFNIIGVRGAVDVQWCIRGNHP